MRNGFGVSYMAFTSAPLSTTPDPYAPKDPSGVGHYACDASINSNAYLFKGFVGQNEISVFQYANLEWNIQRKIHIFYWYDSAGMLLPQSTDPTKPKPLLFPYPWTPPLEITITNTLSTKPK